jgi:hypothetical protein
MDAPLYPPAAHYAQPERIARVLETRTVSLADMMAIPAAWDIVVKALPVAAEIVKAPMLKPFLGNFSLRDLAMFGVLDAALLAPIDVQLKQLGTFK